MASQEYVKHQITSSSSAPKIFIITQDNSKSQLLIELNDTDELEKRIRSMKSDRRYYIGYTDQGIDDYLYTTEPCSEGWEKKAHVAGKPYKLCTYFVKLGDKDKTEYELIQMFEGRKECLNVGAGQKKKGIVYLLEYDYNAGK